MTTHTLVIAAAPLTSRYADGHCTAAQVALDRVLLADHVDPAHGLTLPEPVRIAARPARAARSTH